jgi:hypothetical protein
VVVLHCWCAAPAALPSRQLARRCECLPEPSSSVSRIPQEAGRSGDPGGQAVQKSAVLSVLRPKGASSQVKCIDVTQRSVTLVIANPRSFGYEELHTLPKVPEEYY